MVVQAIWVLSTVCHAAVATDFLDTKHPSLTSVRALAASPSVWLSIFAVVLAAAAAVDDNRNTTLALCTRLAMLLAPSINILSLMLEKRTDFSNRGGYDGIVCRVTIHTAYLLHCRLALRGPQTSCYCARRYDAHWHLDLRLFPLLTERRGINSHGGLRCVLCDRVLALYSPGSRQ